MKIKILKAYTYDELPEGAQRKAYENFLCDLESDMSIETEEERYMEFEEFKEKEAYKFLYDIEGQQTIYQSKLYNYNEFSEGAQRKAYENFLYDTEM